MQAVDWFGERLIAIICKSTTVKKNHTFKKIYKLTGRGRESRNGKTDSLIFEKGNLLPCESIKIRIQFCTSMLNVLTRTIGEATQTTKEYISKKNYEKIGLTEKKE